jgi:uncharacterized protein
MNILASSDIHGYIQIYKHLAYLGKQKDIDIIILAGDLTRYSKHDEEDEIKSILKEINKPVLFIMGNDDGYEWLSEFNMININQIQVKFDDIPFVGYQYSKPFVGGLFEKPEKDQENDFEKLSGLVGSDSILITHGPCHGKLDKAFHGSHVGSKALSDFCNNRSPRYHFFGHIHECFGVEGNHFNLSYPWSKSAVHVNTHDNSYKIIKLKSN